MRPLRLAPNLVTRAYRAGGALATFRGIDARDSYPEDWLASTVSVAGDERTGLSALSDGRLLRDAVEADPAAFFSPLHLDEYGADPRLLVKLLDAGAQLPVHFHPDRASGLTTAGNPTSKAEAWIILDAAKPDRAVRVGFREDVDETRLAEWVTNGSGGELLAALNRLEVSAGDVIFVPGGVPHSIGPGIFMVELQEPSDAAVFLNRDGFEVPLVLGLDDPFDVAVRSADLSSWGGKRLAGVVRRGADATTAITELLPADVSSYFRAQRLAPAGELVLPADYSILVVVEGSGRLTSAAGEALELLAGDTVLIPFSAGDCCLSGDSVVIRALPPLPAKAGAR